MGPCGEERTRKGREKNSEERKGNGKEHATANAWCTLPIYSMIGIAAERQECSTRDRRISIRGQIVVKEFCAAVKIVAKQTSSRQRVVTVLTPPQKHPAVTWHRAVPLQ